jgi:predicted permease
MEALATELKQGHGEPTQADRVAMTLLADEVAGRMRAPLGLLMGAALFVLMVTCFNLAGAILARGLSRTRELAIRLSLGGRRSDIVRHLQLESSVLAVPGALLAIAITGVVLHVLRTSPFSVPRLDEVRLDGAVVALTIVLALLVTATASFFPSLVLTARQLSGWLRTHGAATSPREHRRLWSGFVTGQVALTLVLLSGTGLLLRSLQRVMERDVGYQPERLLAVDVSLPPTLYPEPERRIAYFTQVLDRVRALPGVDAAGLTWTLPHESTARTGSTFALHEPAKSVYAGFRLVDPGYLDALGVTGLRGERLDPARPAANVAVIDDQLAKQLWSEESPLGSRLWNSFHTDTLRVVGTVTSVREWAQEEPVGAVYVDYRSQGDAPLDMHMIVRPATGEVARAVRIVFQELDPMVPVTLEPLERRIARTLGERKLLLSVAGGFAGVSLLLAVLGVYAIVGYALGRELKSVAIRLALGARPAGVIGIVMLTGFRPVALGLFIGLLAVVPALMTVRSQLVDVPFFDPLSILLGTLVLMLGAGAAAWLPARTVRRVDARTILQHD